MRLSAGAVLAALLLLSCRETSPANAPEQAKPELFLLTALPLVWSEEFGLDQPGSPALERLERDYRVTPIDLPSQLPQGALLLAAQPRALPAEELVALDKWVRAGGRVLLLADPVLEWPSELPLGDKRRAPMAFADTGLLQRWGLRLDVPDQRGPREMSLGNMAVLTASPGTLVAIGPPPVVAELVGRAVFAAPPGQRKELKRGCMVGGAGLAARCRIGKGHGVVVADADLLNVGSDVRDDGNLAALISQLASLSR